MITNPPELGAFLKPQLPEAALYGLPGEVTRALAEGSEADPAAILLSFLVMFGNAAGPEPHVTLQGQPQPSRLFVLLVGDAAHGRKGTATGKVERLMRAADPEWADKRIMGGLQSPEALIEQVADDTSDDCRCLIMEDEFQRLLAHLESRGFGPHLRNAWDGRPLRLIRSRRGKAKSNDVIASHAHVSLLASMTPGELLRHHARLSQSGGLESRFLYAFVHRSGDVNPFADDNAVPADLVIKVRHALDRSRTAVLQLADPISRYLCECRGVQPNVVMPVSGDVTRTWLESVRGRLPHVNQDLGSMFQRSETQIVRLAAVYAISDGAVAIAPRHIDAAMALWEYSARSAEIIFGIPVGTLPPELDYRNVAKVTQALFKVYPGWMSKTAISGVFSRNLERAELDVMLEYLARLDKIEKRTTGTRGKPRTEYKLKDPNFVIS